MVEPDILVVIPTVQQEVISVIDVGWKDIFKSSARQSRKVKQGKSKQKGHRNPEGGAANMVGCHDKEEQPLYAFAVGDRNEEKIEVTVGGCKLNMITDSGASTKKNKVKGESARSSRKLCLCI